MSSLALIAAVMVLAICVVGIVVIPVFIAYEFWQLFRDVREMAAKVPRARTQASTWFSINARLIQWHPAVWIPAAQQVQVFAVPIAAIDLQRTPYTQAVAKRLRAEADLLAARAKQAPDGLLKERLLAESRRKALQLEQIEARHDSCLEHHEGASDVSA